MPTVVLKLFARQGSGRTDGRTKRRPYAPKIQFAERVVELMTTTPQRSQTQGIKDLNYLRERTCDISLCVLAVKKNSTVNRLNNNRLNVYNTVWYRFNRTYSQY